VKVGRKVSVNISKHNVDFFYSFFIIPTVVTTSTS